MLVSDSAWPPPGPAPTPPIREEALMSIFTNSPNTAKKDTPSFAGDTPATPVRETPAFADFSPSQVAPPRPVAA